MALCYVNMIFEPLLFWTYELLLSKGNIIYSNELQLSVAKIT
jgi:hypothetical protein